MRAAGPVLSRARAEGVNLARPVDAGTIAWGESRSDETERGGQAAYDSPGECTERANCG